MIDAIHLSLAPMHLIDQITAQDSHLMQRVFEMSSRYHTLYRLHRIFDTSCVQQIFPYCLHRDRSPFLDCIQCTILTHFSLMVIMNIVIF